MAKSSAGRMQFTSQCTDLGLIAFLAIIATSNTSLGGEVTFNVTKPLRNGVASLTFSDADGVKLGQVITDTISSDESAEDKALDIVAELRLHGFDVDRNGTMFTIKNLAAGTQVKFSSLGTGENQDKETALNVIKGEIDFDGTFAALDPLGLPARFTAGVSTDLGQSVVTLSSSDITDLSAAGVATALFDQLAPTLPLGATATLDGGTINLLFNASLTEVSGADVEFGTTSGTGAAGGELSLEPVPEPSTFAMWSMLLGLLGAGWVFKWRGRATSVV